jgi:hypothetical protein
MMAIFFITELRPDLDGIFAPNEVTRSSLLNSISEQLAIAPSDDEVCFRPPPHHFQSNCEGLKSSELKRTYDLNKYGLLNITRASACRAREGRAARVLTCITLPTREVRSSGKPGKKRLSLEIVCAVPVTWRRTGLQLTFTILRISPKMLINPMLFQAVSPPLRSQSIQANNQYTTP